MLEDLKYIPKAVSPLRLELTLALKYRSMEEMHSIRRGMQFFGRALAESGVMRLPEYDMKRVQTILDLARKTSREFTWANDQTITRHFYPKAMKLYERADFISDWEAVPWVEEDWFRKSAQRFLHAAHMSEKVPGNIAFAETVEKGLADRFTSIKPGRYLTRFFGDVLSEDQIRAWAEKCAASTIPAQLKFIESNDPDGWIRIYNDGPDSCMTGEDCVRVYAHSKSVLRLAYLEQGNEVLGRAIVREDKKQYIRVYPNTDSPTNQRLHSRLTSALEAEGYTHGNLNGVLLTAEETGREIGEYVMPYLDRGNGGSQSVDLVTRGSAQYFLVTPDGDHAADSTSGVLTLRSLVSCDCCGDSFDEDELSYVEGHGSICESCLDEYFVTAIAGRNRREIISREDAIYCESNNEYYTESGAEYYGLAQCEETEEWYQMDDLVSTSRGYIAGHHRKVRHLDEPDDDGNDFAHVYDTVQTHDGRTIHVDCAITHNGVTCHKDDDLTELDEESTTQGE